VFNTNPYNEDILYVDIERSVIVKWNDRILRTAASVGAYRRAYYYPSAKIDVHRAVDFPARTPAEKGSIEVSFQLSSPVTNPPPAYYNVTLFYLDKRPTLSLLESSVIRIARTLDYNPDKLLLLTDDGRSLPKPLTRLVADHMDENLRPLFT
jgi:hypothetical protein